MILTGFSLLCSHWMTYAPLLFPSSSLPLSFCMLLLFLLSIIFPLPPPPPPPPPHLSLNKCIVCGWEREREGREGGKVVGGRGYTVAISTRRELSCSILIPHNLPLSSSNNGVHPPPFTPATSTSLCKIGNPMSVTVNTSLYTVKCSH